MSLSCSAQDSVSGDKVIEHDCKALNIPWHGKENLFHILIVFYKRSCLTKKTWGAIIRKIGDINWLEANEDRYPTGPWEFET